MGKTYRREKNVWDDGSDRFDRRNRKRKPSYKMKEDAYQERRRLKNRDRNYEYDERGYER
jgi:hypothetical protein